MNTSSTITRPRFARMYVKAAARAERRGATEHRRRLLEGLSGRVVEVGAGHGLKRVLELVGEAERDQI